MGKKKSRPVQEMLREAKQKDKTDVLGSWTGVPEKPSEKPVQDADDL